MRVIISQSARLQWNTSKCKILCAPEVRPTDLCLSGAKFDYVQAKEYLGDQISGEGIADLASFERIHIAESRLQQLRGIGLFRPRVGIKRLLEVYGALVKPLWMYALPLKLLSGSVLEAADILLGQVTRWLIPRLQPHSRKIARRLLSIKMQPTTQTWGTIASYWEAQADSLHCDEATIRYVKTMETDYWILTTDNSLGGGLSRAAKIGK